MPQNIRVGEVTGNKRFFFFLPMQMTFSVQKKHIWVGRVTGNKKFFFFA